MAIGSILLGVALLVLVSLFIARPFLRTQNGEAVKSERQLLLEEKEYLLDQIQALDFDHDTGKIPTELHEYQRARLVEQATAVLQAIDQASDDAQPLSELEDELDVDIEIEAAIARLRRQRNQKRESSVPADAAVAAANGHARFCPQCGTPTDPDDRFCAHCGHNLSLKTSTKTA